LFGWIHAVHIELRSSSSALLIVVEQRSDFAYLSSKLTPLITYMPFLMHTAIPNQPFPQHDADMLVFLLLTPTIRKLNGLLLVSLRISRFVHSTRSVQAFLYSSNHVIRSFVVDTRCFD